MRGVIDPSEHAGGMRRRGLGNVGRTLLATEVGIAGRGRIVSNGVARRGCWTQVVGRTGQPSPDCPPNHWGDSTERDPFPKSPEQRAPETAL